ncbi:hypothetical protein ACFLU6_06170 [Acidobacteriota bacterium]
MPSIDTWENECERRSIWFGRLAGVLILLLGVILLVNGACFDTLKFEAPAPEEGSVLLSAGAEQGNDVPTTRETWITLIIDLPNDHTIVVWF